MKKFCFDLFPVIVFFTTYYMIDIYAATAATIIASGLQVVYLILRQKGVEKMYYFIFATILVLGGATIILHDPNFIKWKPTIVNWALAITFLGSEFVGPKSFVKRMFETALDLTAKQWRQMNFNFVALFTICGILNLMVAFTCSESTWVNFKLFGLTAINMLFMVGQIFYLRPHLIPLPEEDAKPTEETAQPEE